MELIARFSELEASVYFLGNEFKGIKERPECLGFYQIFIALGTFRRRKSQEK